MFFQGEDVRRKSDLTRPANDASEVGELRRRGNVPDLQHESPIRAAFNVLTIQCKELGEVVGHLEGRLKPFCLPRPPEDSEKEREEPRTEFSGALCELAGFLEADTQRLRSLLDRLGV